MIRKEREETRAKERMNAHPPTLTANSKETTNAYCTIHPARTWLARSTCQSTSLFAFPFLNCPPRFSSAAIFIGRWFSPGPGIVDARRMAQSTSVFGLAMLNCCEHTELWYVCE